MVASGGKWIDEFGLEEDKLHLHWRLDKPTRTPEEHELLRQARVLAARIVGADLSAGPPVHPIRWPGSIHRKSTPRLCRIVEHSDAEINLIEALAWLEVEGPHYGVVAKGEAKGKGKVREPKGEAGEPNESLIGDIRDVRAALAAIPNDTLDYHWWNHMMMMIWGATGGV